MISSTHYQRNFFSIAYSAGLNVSETIFSMMKRIAKKFIAELTGVDAIVFQSISEVGSVSFKHWGNLLFDGQLCTANRAFALCCNFWLLFNFSTAQTTLYQQIHLQSFSCLWYSLSENTFHVTLILSQFKIL